MDRVSQILDTELEKLKALNGYLFGQGQPKIEPKNPNIYYRRKIGGHYLKHELQKKRKQFLGLRGDYKAQLPAKFVEERSALLESCKMKAGFKMNFILDEVLGSEINLKRLDDFYRRD